MDLSISFSSQKLYFHSLCANEGIKDKIDEFDIKNNQLFLAHSRTQCLWSGTAVSGQNPSSAASKLEELDMIKSQGVPTLVFLLLLR